jgi:hypothetical protein
MRTSASGVNELEFAVSSVRVDIFRDKFAHKGNLPEAAEMLSHTTHISGLSFLLTATWK